MMKDTEYIYSLHKATLFTLQQMGYKNTEIAAKSEKNRHHLRISAEHKNNHSANTFANISNTFYFGKIFWKNNNDDEREITHKQHHNIPLSVFSFQTINFLFLLRIFNFHFSFLLPHLPAH